MSPANTSPPLPRKKPNILWWVGGVFLLIFLWLLYQLFGANPAIVVSKQTTYLTEPLGKDGLPDYEKYLLAQFREGVTPENNAAALVIRATWPPHSTNEGDVRLIAAELGIDLGALDPAKTVEEKLSWKRVSDWQLSLLAATLAQAVKKDISDQDEQFAGETGERALMITDTAVETAFGADSAFVLDIVSRAGERPWTTKQIPPLAEWVKDYKAGLDIIVEASRRPRFYSPSQTLLDDDHNHGSLAGILQPGIQNVREATRCLLVRAMWETGEGDFESAWSDLFALLRLSRLTYQGNTLIDKMVGLANQGITVGPILSLLASENLSTDEARHIQADLNSLGDFPSMSSVVEFERITLLDFFVAIGNSSRESKEWLQRFFGQDQKIVSIGYTRVDWNAGLMEVNRWFERGVAASQLADPGARKQALQQIERDLDEANATYDGALVWAGTMLSPAAKGQYLARRLLPVYLHFQFGTSTLDRANCELDLLQLAAALAVYRCEKGSYPETLEALVPGFIPELPVDLYNAQPFVYTRDKDGYLLYSLGKNGTDDGGSHVEYGILEGRDTQGANNDETIRLRAKIPGGADDAAIRVPRPAFEMPATPQLPK